MIRKRPLSAENPNPGAAGLRPLAGWDEADFYALVQGFGDPLRAAGKNPQVAWRFGGIARFVGTCRPWISRVILRRLDAGRVDVSASRSRLEHLVVWKRAP